MDTNKESPKQGVLQGAGVQASACAGNTLKRELQHQPRSSREMINLIRVNSCLFVVLRGFLLHGYGEWPRQTKLGRSR